MTKAPDSQCGNCAAKLNNHIADPNHERPRCPGGKGTRFEPAPDMTMLGFDREELVVLKIVLSEAHRYGTLRASNPALKRLQARFTELADKRAVRAVKAASHRT